jgi:tropomyosin
MARGGGCLQRLASLRIEADAAVERAEAAEKRNKELEQLLLANEQEIKSLTHRNGLLEGELEKNESKIMEFKSEKAAGENSHATVDGLTRKVQILEGDLENTERRLQESASK